MEFAYGVGGPAQWQRDIIIPPGMAFICSFLPLFFDAQAAGRSLPILPLNPVRAFPYQSKVRLRRHNRQASTMKKNNLHKTARRNSFMVYHSRYAGFY
jgi:hypothetical protein